MKSHTEFTTLKLTAAIIAGGKSKRFGAPKAEALYRGRRLIDYALDIARSIAAEVCIATGAEKRWADEDGAAAFKDEIPDCGPLGGVYTALLHTSNSWVATIPCDMPLLDRNVYRVLYARRSGLRPVVAVSDAGLEPLVTLWPREAIVAVRTAIREGDLALHTLIRALDGIEVDDFHNIASHAFFNINFQSDLDVLRTL